MTNLTLLRALVVAWVCLGVLIPPAAGRKAAPRTIRALVDQLKHGNDAARSRAAQRLYHLQDPQGNAAVLALARDETEHLRAVGVWALSAVRPPGGEKIVVQSLRDPSLAVRLAAIDSVGAWRLTRATRQLRVCLRDRESSVRSSTIRALARLGPRGLTVLRRLLRSGTLEQQLLTVSALRELGTSSSIATLRRAAGHAEPAARLLAAEALYARGDPVGLQQLCRLLRGASESGIRLQAVQMVANNHSQPARAALRKALGDPDLQVRRAAVDALATPRHPGDTHKR